MLSERSPREARLAATVCEVVCHALAARGAARVALLDDGTPEAELAARWLGGPDGVGELVCVRAERLPGVEPLLRSLGAEPGTARAAEELRRLAARLLPDALVTNPANKTALLLGAAWPPEPLLPLADLYASQVAQLAGGCSLPPEVEALAEAAGGVARLDEALTRRFEQRDPAGLAGLGAPLAEQVEAALQQGRAARIAPQLVPKLGYRTLTVDLFE